MKKWLGISLIIILIAFASWVYSQTTIVGDWGLSGNNLYYTGGNVGIGTSVPAATLHIGGSNTFRKDSTGLVFSVDLDNKISNWDAISYGSSPPLNPNDGNPHIMSLYGDILTGDLFAINGSTSTSESSFQVAKRNPGLTTAQTTNYYSNKNINNDTNGGAGITLVSDQTGSVNSGYINIVGYGRGTGPLANSIRLLTRSGVNTISDRMIIAGGGNVGIGTISPNANAQLDINGAIKIADTGTKPLCSSTNRGMIWHDFGAAGVKDTVEICAKDISDVYAWRVIY